MPKALKVYRTSAGFHDAYVATPSKAAALRAWGSERDLFVWGAAEEVTDPVLMKGALAAPGTVIKRLRGSDAEQIAALDADKAHPKPGQRATATKSKSKPRPRPRRDRLDKAKAALSAAEVRQSDERAGLTLAKVPCATSAAGWKPGNTEKSGECGLLATEQGRCMKRRFVIGRAERLRQRERVERVAALIFFAFPTQIAGC